MMFFLNAFGGNFLLLSASYVAQCVITNQNLRFLVSNAFLTALYAGFEFATPYEWGDETASKDMLEPRYSHQELLEEAVPTAQPMDGVFRNATEPAQEIAAGGAAVNNLNGVLPVQALELYKVLDGPDFGYGPNPFLHPTYVQDLEPVFPLLTNAEIEHVKEIWAGLTPLQEEQLTAAAHYVAVRQAGLDPTEAIMAARAVGAPPNSNML